MENNKIIEVAFFEEHPIFRDKDIEEQVNYFLKESSQRIDGYAFVDVKYSTCGLSNDDIYHSALVIYKRNR